MYMDEYKFGSLKRKKNSCSFFSNLKKTLLDEELARKLNFMLLNMFLAQYRMHMYTYFGANVYMKKLEK